jgi:hypothetical protein
MTRDEISKWLEDRDQVTLLADGLDEAFLGIDTSGDEPRAVYSTEKCIEILAREMGREDAVEYFDFNVAGAYVGPQTPIFIQTP